MAGGDPYEAHHGDYLLSTDRARLDLDWLHEALSTAYWATGIPRDVMERSIEHSAPFGLYLGERQVGFTRAVTDSATFGFITDVYVDPEHRGKGLAKFMVERVLRYPAFQSFRRWCLLTRDAHGLYRQLGFTDLRSPDRWM
jgi:GNAT superfamily N-acetyltransferase